MANYYDRVLEDLDLSRESEGYGDESSDESSDEGIYDRRRPIRVPSSIGRFSNFGKNITGGGGGGSSQGQGNYATKSELKSSLSSISDQVNDLKKANLSLGSSIARLDKTNESVVKGIAKKDKSQDSVMNSTTMMTMLGALINKPTFNADALKIVSTDSSNTAGDPKLKILNDDKAKTDTIQVDLTKTLLFTMMPMMMSGSSSGSDSNMMMPLMMVLLLDKKGTSSGSSSLGSDSNTLVLVMMMMMMNKK